MLIHPAANMAYDRQILTDFLLTMTNVSGYITLVTLANNEFVRITQASSADVVAATPGQSATIQLQTVNADSSGISPVGGMILEATNAGTGGRGFNTSYVGMMTSTSPPLEFTNKTGAPVTLYVNAAFPQGNNHSIRIVSHVYRIL